MRPLSRSVFVLRPQVTVTSDGEFVHLTPTGDLVLPYLSTVNYDAAVDLEDCDTILGTGISFLSSDSSTASGVVALPKSYRMQSMVYVVNVSSLTTTGAGAAGAAAGAAASGTTLVGSNDNDDGSNDDDDDGCIIYALASGLVFVANSDYGRVELRELKEGETERYVWKLRPHPITGTMISMTTEDGRELVWTINAPADAFMSSNHASEKLRNSASACSSDGMDCLFDITLKPIDGSGTRRPSRKGNSDHNGHVGSESGSQVTMRSSFSFTGL